MVLQDYSLTCSGFLWKIDKLLDVAWLQDRNGGAWALILFYTTYFRRVEDEGQDFENFLRPFVAFFAAERPASFNELRSIVVRLSTTELTDWKPPYDRRALKIETFALHCEILLHLTLFLRSSNELGLADAIWNSTQAVSWPLDDPFKDADDVPASVEDFPSEMPQKLHVDTLFEFEADGRGGWLQSWIVERVMTRGQLWYGNLVKTSSDNEWLARASELKLKSGEHVNDISRAFVAAELRSEPGSAGPQEQSSYAERLSTSQLSLSSEGKENSERKLRGRHASQMVMSILTRKALDVVVEEAGHKPDRDSSDDPGAYAAFMHSVAHGEEVESTLQSRRAFFDVDEPCLVLTPFNTNLEVLPRPETRAMSSSWVVRKREGSGSGVEGRGSDVAEVFEFVGKVRGMWAVGFYASMRYAVSCVHGVEDEGDENGGGHGGGHGGMTETDCK